MGKVDFEKLHGLMTEFSFGSLSGKFARDFKLLFSVFVGGALIWTGQEAA